IFARPRDFVLEVGCGHGHFLTAYAHAHPDELCIGIDIENDRIRRAERKRERAKLQNLHFIHSEVSLFLNALPTGARCAEIFMLFPVPWPKRRHHKHRILQPDFLSLAADHARPYSRLSFRTDHCPYFTDAAAAVRDHPRWELTDEPWP